MTDLNTLREKIDKVDELLLVLIKKRLEIVREIGDFKKSTGQPVIDQQREKEKIENLQKKGKIIGIPPEVVEKVWKVYFEIAYLVEGKNSE